MLDAMRDVGRDAGEEGGERRGFIAQCDSEKGRV